MQIKLQIDICQDDGDGAKDDKKEDEDDDIHVLFLLMGAVSWFMSSVDRWETESGDDDDNDYKVFDDYDVYDTYDDDN